MDSMVKVYLDRADNEAILADAVKKLSDENDVKQSFKIDKHQTFYSAVISHSYYAIFYSAKAILLTKNIKTDWPDVHRKTLDAFKEQLVDTGILDVKLLEIYRKMVVRADKLLQIFREEKKKRGDFTYKTLPQANREPADDSVKNAKTFVSNIKKIIETME
ncbi:MAG: HEPN domain-containing protein [Methanocellales archaeon]|nr:HEPN domain-containing protein [Methanocellales archaeon]MDD3292201.1 HEPN domain-containing protein [Methanocellales archaeon]MDD5235732.1 HEPN domain-containing protein [Methanocellales archaeon]MDD5485797.1 HEPN domain-containing protein [Methanocellales archaeon]